MDESKISFENREKVGKSSRNMELIIGFIGGIFGVLGGIGLLMLACLGKAFDTTISSDIIILGTLTIMASITGAIGVLTVRNNRKLGGSIMIISGIIGVISILVFYIIGGFFLVFRGVLT